MDVLSQDTVQKISNIFIGDEGDWYIYKKGSQLVAFFNEYYGAGEHYGHGFPSRWIYVYDKLVVLLNQNKFDSFLNIVLSKKYIAKEQGCSLIEATERVNVILEVFRSIVKVDGYIIVNNNNQFHLLQENQDLVLLGSGGFANAYKQKSTGLVIKKLKEDFWSNSGIRSRFKREYEITKSLQDLPGIVKVYDFDKNTYSYTMELAEETFEKYILNSEFDEATKIKCIRMILGIMKEVHQRDIIHRDLSPNNIFVIQGHLKIADFGLGKDLNMFTSHQTIHTNTVGQYFYCAPEQFMMLRDGNKRSDVYSLGRIINFIMTENPNDSHHAFRSVAEKATNSDAAYRYADAGQLCAYFEKSVLYHSNAEQKEAILNLIAEKNMCEKVENYIYELPALEICKMLISKQKGFKESLLKFMEIDEGHASLVIQAVDGEFQNCCKTFESNDPIADFVYDVLRGHFAYVVNETAANILRYIAKDVNRFQAQHLMENILNQGVEPLIEEILES